MSAGSKPSVHHGDWAPFIALRSGRFAAFCE
jgi:hypothetical protein